MRIEELMDNNYIKNADSVERYLLDIIKQYFDSSGINLDSKEYIIQLAINKIREELRIDNAGVISVNGKTGNVTITLEELGGEPKIVPKRTAFNVNFGTTKGTACEGNDPRLYDKREPLEHTHEISEINGLEGELSKIRNSIENTNVQTHSHNNLDVLNKLTYTGTKDVIDLTLLDNAEEIINEKITETEEVIEDVTKKTNDLITEIREILEKFDAEAIKQYAREQDTELKTKIENYFDTELNKAEKEIDEELDKKINKTQYNDLIIKLNTQFHIISDETINYFVNTNGTRYNYQIPDEVTDKLNNLTDEEYKIDYFITYVDPTLGKEVTTNLPFILAENNVMAYTIKAEKSGNSIYITSTKNNNIPTWANYITSAKLRIRISIKNNFEVI